MFCVKVDKLSLLQEIKGLREELATRLNSSDTMEIIREKEEQIRGLLEEGNALIHVVILTTVITTFMSGSSMFRLHYSYF